MPSKSRSRRSASRRRCLREYQKPWHNTLTACLNLCRFYDTNPQDAVGRLNLSSAPRTFRRRAYSSQLAESAIISNAVIIETRLKFQIGSPITQFDPVTPSTQFVRPGLATEGESRSADLRTISGSGSIRFP